MIPLIKGRGRQELPVFLFGRTFSHMQFKLYGSFWFPPSLGQWGRPHAHSRNSPYNVMNEWAQTTHPPSVCCGVMHCSDLAWAFLQSHRQRWLLSNPQGNKLAYCSRGSCCWQDHKIILEWGGTKERWAISFFLLGLSSGCKEDKIPRHSKLFQWRFGACAALTAYLPLTSVTLWCPGIMSRMKSQ